MRPYIFVFISSILFPVLLYIKDIVFDTEKGLLHYTIQWIVFVIAMSVFIYIRNRRSKKDKRLRLMNSIMKQIIAIPALLVVLLMYFNSCSSGIKDRNTISSIGKNESLDVINIDEAEEVDNILYSSLFKSPQSIILETNDNCLIKTVDRIQVHQNNIYILDTEYKNLLVFDMNGTFIHKIGSVGNGVGEFTDISDFTIDIPNNVIYLLDKYANEVLKYDATSGKFIETIKIEANDVTIAAIQYVSGYLYANANPLSKNAGKHLLMKFNLPEGNLQATYLDADMYNKGWNFPLHIESGLFYSRNASSPKHVQMFMDTIVAISADTIIPVFAIKSKNFTTHKDIEEVYKIYDKPEGYAFAPLKDKIYNINSCVEFNDFVYFQFYKGNYRHYLLFDELTQRAKITKFFINDYIKSDCLIPMELFFNDENGVYSLLKQDFMSYFVEIVKSGQLNPKIDKYEELLKIEDDANPIIFFHEYKE